MNKLKEAVFKNMDALIENDHDYCFGEDPLELTHNMHEETGFLFELYKNECVKHINEWRKLKLPTI